MLMLELLMVGAVAVAAAPQTSAPQAAPAAKVVPVIQGVHINLGRLPRCDGQQVLQVADKAQSPEALRLGELPKANFELAVSRTVDGCVEPAVVSYGVGK